MRLSKGKRYGERAEITYKEKCGFWHLEQVVQLCTHRYRGSPLVWCVLVTTEQKVMIIGWGRPGKFCKNDIIQHFNIVTRVFRSISDNQPMICIMTPPVLTCFKASFAASYVDIRAHLLVIIHAKVRPKPYQNVLVQP
jgi:hypothetical protein